MIALLAAMLRSALCADCRAAVAVTFWRSIHGPALCLGCAGRRLTDLETRPI